MAIKKGAYAPFLIAVQTVAALFTNQRPGERSVRSDRRIAGVRLRSECQNGAIGESCRSVELRSSGSDARGVIGIRAHGTLRDSVEVEHDDVRGGVVDVEHASVAFCRRSTFAGGTTVLPAIFDRLVLLMLGSGVVPLVAELLTFCAASGIEIRAAKQVTITARFTNLLMEFSPPRRRSTQGSGRTYWEGVRYTRSGNIGTSYGKSTPSVWSKIAACIFETA